MDNKKFEPLLILIVPEVVKKIAESYKLDEIAASEGQSLILCKPKIRLQNDNII